MNAFESIPTAPTTDCQCNICKGQRALEQLPTLQKQHDELREKHRALESVFQDAQTERDMHTAAYNELRGLVKNMLDAYHKPGPWIGIGGYMERLNTSINYQPLVKERDLAKDINEVWCKSAGLEIQSGLDLIAFVLIYLKQHPEALKSLTGGADH